MTAKDCYMYLIFFSLVNVLVYSIRDKQFRKYAVDSLSPRSLKKEEVKKKEMATRIATNTNTV